MCLVLEDRAVKETCTHTAACASFELSICSTRTSFTRITCRVLLRCTCMPGLVSMAQSIKFYRTCCLIESSFPLKARTCVAQHRLNHAGSANCPSRRKSWRASIGMLWAVLVISSLSPLPSSHPMEQQAFVLMATCCSPRYLGVLLLLPDSLTNCSSALEPC